MTADSSCLMSKLLRPRYRLNHTFCIFQDPMRTFFTNYLLSGGYPTIISLGKYYYVYLSIRKGFVANKPKMDFDFLPVVTRLKPQMLAQVLWFRRPKTGVAGASSRAQKYLEIGLTFLQKYLCPDLRSYSYNAADYKV